MLSSTLDLVARFRRKIQDTGGDTGPAPSGYTYYWEYDDRGCFIPNAAVVEMLNEAQVELCRRYPIKDSTSSVCQIGVVADEANYTLDPSILGIERVKLTTADRVLAKTTAWLIDTEDTRLLLDGEVRYYHENLRDHTLTLVGTPAAADTLELSVLRLPVQSIAWGDEDSGLEIAELYIEDLLLYAQYLAYSIQDFDLFDAEAANTAMQRYRSHVGEPITPRGLGILKELSGAHLRIRSHF